MTIQKCFKCEELEQQIAAMRQQVQLAQGTPRMSLINARIAAEARADTAASALEAAQHRIAELEAAASHLEGLQKEHVEKCIRCGHHRQMHGKPCGFHSCGCPQFFGSEAEIALSTEQTMRAAWEKRAYEAEAHLEKLQSALAICHERIALLTKGRDAAESALEAAQHRIRLLVDECARLEGLLTDAHTDREAAARLIAQWREREAYLCGEQSAAEDDRVKAQLGHRIDIYHRCADDLARVLGEQP